MGVYVGATVWSRSTTPSSAWMTCTLAGRPVMLALHSKEPGTAREAAYAGAGPGLGTSTVSKRGPSECDPAPSHWA